MSYIIEAILLKLEEDHPGVVDVILAVVVVAMQQSGRGWV